MRNTRSDRWQRRPLRLSVSWHKERPIPVRYVIVAGLLVIAAAAQAADTHVSPDRKCRATVVAVNRTHESRVTVRCESDRPFQRTYQSSDGEHGGIVSHIAWTADSRFVVYSLYSSGGHSPMYSPIWVYDRGARKLCSLDRQLELVTSFDEFKLKKPSIVTVRGSRGLGHSDE